MVKFNEDLLIYANLIILGFRKEKNMEFTSLQFTKFGSANLFAINKNSNTRIIFTIYHDGFLKVKSGDSEKEYDKKCWLDNLKNKASLDTIKGRVPKDIRDKILK